MGGVTQDELTGILTRSFERIVDWAAVTTERVAEDYRSRGVITTRGTPVRSFEDIRWVHPHMSRRVSRAYIATNWKLAAGQGFVTGVGGMVALPAAAPADAVAYVAWLARTASAVQYAHGLGGDAAGTGGLELGMLAGAGVRDLSLGGSTVLVRQVARRAVGAPYTRIPVRVTARALAARLGVCQASGGFARCVPLIGGAINGTLTAGMVRNAGTRILDHYQELVGSGQGGVVPAAG